MLINVNFHISSKIYLLHFISVRTYRMFGSCLESSITKSNENGEYEVSKGVSSVVFKSILVSRSNVLQAFANMYNIDRVNFF